MACAPALPEMSAVRLTISSSFQVKHRGDARTQDAPAKAFPPRGALVVVHGTAAVKRDAEALLVRENESLYLPLGCVHRPEDRGRIPRAITRLSRGGRYRPPRRHLRPDRKCESGG
jgi:hypothetical protein